VPAAGRRPLPAQSQLRQRHGLSDAAYDAMFTPGKHIRAMADDDQELLAFEGTPR
jgi:hypothetical protein